MAAERKTLSVPRGRGPSREELFAAAVQNLMLDKRFRMVMLTFIEAAGIFDAASTPKSELVQWAQGRRSLGFDMIRTLAKHTGDDEMGIIALLLADRPPKEANNEHRSGSDYADGRSGDDDNDDAGRPAEPELAGSVIRYDD